MLLFEKCTPPGVPNNDWSPFLAFVSLGHVWNLVHLDEGARFVQEGCHEFLPLLSNPIVYIA